MTVANLPADAATARVVTVQEGLLQIEAIADTDGRPGQLVKNEVVYILPSRAAPSGRQERLKAEVLRVRGAFADVQVYESTDGVAVGDPVVQTGQLLSVELGPGLLGQVFDGLQSPLPKVAAAFGTFLPRGADVAPLDDQAKWSFTPSVKVGDTVTAGDCIGTVPEGRFSHKIMVPFNWARTYKVVWIQKGAATIHDIVARLEDETGNEITLTLSQKWPVRRPLPETLLKNVLSQRLHPEEPVLTSQRLIDTFFPIARGGTACIPGPFGAGKTVLQNLIARNAKVDIVIVVACGERAGEVVETINEFPKMTDPVSGGEPDGPDDYHLQHLFDACGVARGVNFHRRNSRRILPPNGLRCPADRRQYQPLGPGHAGKRLVNLREIPGEEGFPAYLESSIKGLYERAGLVKTNDGDMGSLTLIGTVSPAGGNFDEPVTTSYPDNGEVFSRSLF